MQQLPLLSTVSPIQQKVSVFEVSAQEEKMVLLELEQQTLVLLLSQCLSGARAQLGCCSPHLCRVVSGAHRAQLAQSSALSRGSTPSPHLHAGSLAMLDCTTEG